MLKIIKKLIYAVVFIVFVCFLYMYHCYLTYSSFGICCTRIKAQFEPWMTKVQEEIYLVIDREFRGPSVSFCTTYRDRFEQISQTLPKNLADNRIDKDHVEFVLIDFDPSDDKLKNYIFENFSQDIASGYLKYYQTNMMPIWDFSLAKNTAHYYATKEVVVNLDADNYTGYRGGLYVAHTLAENRQSFLWQLGLITDGNYGRISFYKKDFDRLGGYDENMPAPAGYQDDDIVNRAKSFLVLIHKKSHNQFIPNSKEETVKHTGKSISYEEMVEKNKDYSKNNIKNGKFRANNGIYGIRQNVFKITSQTDEVE